MIIIVDYGMGNLGSISNMFKRIGVSVHVSGDRELIRAATKLLLPGVGAFDSAIRQIESKGLRDVLDNKVLGEGIPVLGICLGMQLMTRSSEEGVLPGLGWVDARTIRFPRSGNLKVPHMGWNIVTPVKPSRLTDALPDESRFYFVHSYYVRVAHERDALLKASYGLEFDAAIEAGNIFGAQFHPEKSHKFGMTLLRNFAGL